LLVHYLQVGTPLPGFPKVLWPARPRRGLPRVLDAWFAEKKHRLDTRDLATAPTIDDLFRLVPHQRIMLRPVIRAEGMGWKRYQALQEAQGRAVEEINRRGPETWGELRRGALGEQGRQWLDVLREPDRYLHEHSRLAFAWYAQDVIAAAWCELLHAWQTGATARRCETCGVAYLRPKAYPGKLCRTCRQVNWRQHAKIRIFPQEKRLALALEVWRANVEGRRFDEWDTWEKSEGEVDSRGKAAPRTQ
jgi:aryl carrier-like protein